MRVNCTEDVGAIRYYYLDNGAIVTIELPLEDYSGWDLFNVKDDEYAEGRLWFESGVLVDFDGVYSLPEEVYEALRHSGIKVDS